MLLPLPFPTPAVLAPPSPQGASAPEPIHAFDFLEGRWRIRHRRLKGILCGSSEWTTFDTLQDVRPLVGRLGTLSEMRSPSGEPVGVTLHLFEKASGTWSLYWLGKGGTLEVPVVGGFSSGVGTFLAKDEYQGRPIRVRWTWTRTTTRSPQWEQAFSADGGRTWETNWVMSYEPAR